MGISDVIALLSGVALFLFGMTLMGDGLKSVAGSKLELILYKLSGTPFKGILLGTGVTAVIQSSSATSVMVVGFVNSGMMKVRQSIGIIMGAIFGTSITGWILCLSSVGGGAEGWAKLLSTTTLTGIIAVVGIYLRMFSKKRLNNHIGDILLGFAVLMTGMQMMSAAVGGLKDDPKFISMMTSFKNPFLGILVGLVATAILQSASASVGILQALAISVNIDFSTALPIILGIAIGASVPVIISSIGTNVNGKRSAFIYLLIEVIGVAILAPLFYIINAVYPFPFMNVVMTPVTIALLNSVFRFIKLIMFIPFIGLFEKIVCWMFKDDPEDLEDTADIDRLEDRFISHPSIAIEQSNSAVCSMADKSRKNLARSLILLSDYSQELFNKIQAKEQVIDRYEDKLGTYLVKLTSAELSSEQSQKVSLFLHTIGDFERIADHAVNISVVAQEIYEKKMVFSESARQEMAQLESAISGIVLMTTDAFINNDLSLAEQVEPLEEVIDIMCDEMKLHHIQRVQNGFCTLQLGFSFNDLLTNYERIADHCSNIAVAMIELNRDVFDTHEYLNTVKNEKSNEFTNYFKIFSERYNKLNK